MRVEILLFAFVACGISAWLTWRFSRSGSRFYILDHPKERSLHTRPTPRTGGIAIVTSCFAAGLAAVLYFDYARPRMAWLAAASLLVAGTSFLDDRLQLPPATRIVSHFIAAGVLMYGGLVLDTTTLPGVTWTLPAALAMVVTPLYIVWMINLYNFMDGMDGFAGGMAVFGFGTFAALGVFAGHELFAVFNLIVVAAAAGFLLFNFPPARIFMGDTGSSTLGLLAAAFSLWGAEQGIFDFWMGILVFSPFIVDATVTLLRRLWQREKVWQAHKTHYYQRLVQAGWGHRKSVLIEYAIMLGCGITALLAVHASAEVQVAMLAMWALVYLIFFFWVARFAARRHSSSTAT